MSGTLMRESEGNDLPQMEITLDDIPIAPPAGIYQLLTSIFLDLGEIPDEYLVAAGPGEYDPSMFEEKVQDSDAVWQGTYHEEGATFYPEWDFGRQLYRKNWCVKREKDVPHMYGAANYVVVDEVVKLPFKGANIYRRLTI